MKRPFLAGRMVYWLGWPVSFASLYFSRRSRVLIICGGEVLLVKNWMGSGDWHTPGGGLKRGELPADGAARELEEELGLDIDPDKLRLLYNRRITNRRRLSYYAYCYALVLKQKPELELDTRELAEASWHELSEVRRSKLGWPLVGDMLDAWERADRL